MKLLKIELSLSERGFKKFVIEYEMEEKPKSYVHPNTRINKSELLNVNSIFRNGLPGLWISYKTMCLPVNEDQAVILIS